MSPSQKDGLPSAFVGDGIKNAGALDGPIRPPANVEEEKNIKKEGSKVPIKKASSLNQGEEFDDGGEEKRDWRQIFLQEKMMGEPQTIP